MPPRLGRERIAEPGLIRPVRVLHLLTDRVRHAKHLVFRVLGIREYRPAELARHVMGILDRPGQLAFLRPAVARRAPHEPESGLVRHQDHHSGFGQIHQ